MKKHKKKPNVCMVPEWARVLSALVTSRWMPTPDGPGGVQAHVAKVTGLSPSTVSRYLTGARTPQPLHLRQILDAVAAEGQSIPWPQVEPVLLLLGRAEQQPYSTLVETWRSAELSPEARQASWERVSWPAR